MVSKYGKDFQVPKDFPSVLKAFTREVLRSQPTNVYEFGAAYFQQLLAQAQSATAAEGGAETRLTPAQMEQMLIQLFKNADVDGSGELSMQEFKDLIKIANLGLSDADLTRLMAEADVNHDGKIDYGEFVPLAVTSSRACTPSSTSRPRRTHRRSARASPPTSTCCTA